MTDHTEGPEGIHDAVMALINEGLPIGLAVYQVKLSDKPDVLQPVAAVVINAAVTVDIRVATAARVVEMLRAIASQLEAGSVIPDTIPAGMSIDPDPDPDRGPLDPIQREALLRRLHDLVRATGAELEYDDPMLAPIENLQGLLGADIWNHRRPEDIGR